MNTIDIYLHLLHSFFSLAYLLWMRAFELVHNPLESSIFSILAAVVIESKNSREDEDEESELEYEEEENYEESSHHVLFYLETPRDICI
ncbi:unnamed protein product [Rodentolepis nana]|uniref:Ovule protein n=1 Tax=Rodentolepis nana TaxID=102285 RepID=A0A0R3TS29_RODNA|nr:unnamed protein product [Rodentolepis nana]